MIFSGIRIEKIYGQKSEGKVTNLKGAKETKKERIFKVKMKAWEKYYIKMIR